MRFDDIDQAIKRSDLVAWAAGQTDATVTLTAMDMAYIGSILALFQANAWLSNEPDETLTIFEIDHAMWSLFVEGDIVKIAIIKDEKPQGSNGGTFTAGSWIQRTLNTTLDPAGLASLASNTITIVQGGNYYIRALAPAYGVYSHQSRLLVNNNPVAIGTTNYTHPTYGGMNHSVVVWCGNLIAGNTVTLEHRCFGTQATYGFGTDSGQTWGNNVYSVVEIIQYS